MNLYEELNIKEKDLIKYAGINLENRKYESDELKTITNRITEFIMSHSLKNDDIKNLENDYRHMFSVIDRAIL